MYICTVMCCAVGTTDQAVDPGSGTVRCLLIQYEGPEEASVRHNNSETLDMIASDIFVGPPENKLPTGKHSRIKYDVVVTGDIVGGPAQNPKAKSGARQALLARDYNKVGLNRFSGASCSPHSGLGGWAGNDEARRIIHEEPISSRI